MPTGQGIWVDLTENRQMVLHTYGAKKRDELETPSSPKAGFTEMSMNDGKRRGAHHLKHRRTELSYCGEKGRAIMGQIRGFCLYLKKEVNTS